jgi:hypothetical protein
VAEPITLAFELTRAEYAAGAHAVPDRLIKGAAIGGVGLLAVGVGARFETTTVLGILLILAAVIAWAQPWWRWYVEPALHAEEQWRIDEQGCTIHRAGSQMRNQWAFYRELIEVGGVYALVTSRATLDVVPKRAFASEEDATAFVAFVRPHVAVRESEATASSGWTD